MGLLNAIASGISGAFSGALDAYKLNQGYEQETAMTNQRAKLELDKAKQILELQKQYQIEEENRKREAGVAQGKQINDLAQKAQDESIANKIYDPQGPNLSAQDISDRRASGVKVGDDKLDRMTSLEMRAKAAEDLGYLAAAKETREQIRTELLDKRMETESENTNKRLDNQERYNFASLSEQIRHNQVIEAAARRNNSLSPAAKVGLEIASAGLGAAQKAEGEAAKALNEANKGFDQAAKDQARNEYRQAKEEVKKAMQFYSETGKQYLGADFKTISISTEQSKPKEKEPPSGASILKLIQNPGSADVFDKQFGAGMAKKFLSDPEVTKNASTNNDLLKSLGRVLFND